MTQNIIKIWQDNEGDINPGTNLFETPVWRIMFEDSEEKIRVLGKSKMEEYISKSYNKTVHRFKRWKIKTKLTETFIYAIVFTDKTHEVVPAVNMIDIIYRGHSVRNDEKYKHIETELASKGGQSPIFIPDVQESV
tara:strand:- start:334 stop:741 length:408 start_codon:yes stop_codon:yes gene_type:complete